MKTNTLWKQFAIVLALGVALLGFPAYPAASSAITADPMTGAALSGNPTPLMPLMANSSNVVTEWNQQAVSLALTTTPALAPIRQFRVMAIVQVAVHDAVNGITGKYETYATSSRLKNASPEAAAIAAAYHALRNIFTTESQLIQLDAFYAASLATHGILETDPALEIGRTAALNILALRANDNSAQAQFAYDAPGVGAPGVWERLNNAPASLPGWGNVTPFVLRSGSQFRPDAPLALDSEQYAQDYNEIKQIGVLNSTVRTAEQTQIATFWLASPTAIWNPVLNHVLATRSFDISDTSRAFALFYLAAADAGIACWDAKYTYNFWRPQSAIRRGDEDGNDLTAGDGTWTPLFATPPHPEYPSGHSTISSSMASILELLFNDNPGMPITVTLSGITRQWSSFSEGVAEVIDARVYSGIHYRTSDEVGARLGRQVATFVSKHALRLCPKRGCF